MKCYTTAEALSMIFVVKDSAYENSDTDTDSSGGSNEDLLSKVCQENFFLPLHGSTPVGKVLGNLHGHRGVLFFNIGCGDEIFQMYIYIYIYHLVTQNKFL